MFRRMIRNYLPLSRDSPYALKRGVRHYKNQGQHVLQQNQSGIVQKQDASQNTEIRPVRVTVTATRVGNGIVRAYPDDDGHTYNVPALSNDSYGDKF